MVVLRAWLRQRGRIRAAEVPRGGGDLLRLSRLARQSARRASPHADTLGPTVVVATPQARLSGLSLLVTIDGRLELRSIESAEHVVSGRPRRTRTKHAQEFSTESHSIRELIARLPTPCGDHCENELPTVAEQRSIDARIVLTDRVGDMSEIELDGSAAARLEVNEQRSVRGVEHVAGMRFAVK